MVYGYDMWHRRYGRGVANRTKSETERKTIEVKSCSHRWLNDRFFEKKRSVPLIANLPWKRARFASHFLTWLHNYFAHFGENEHELLWRVNHFAETTAFFRRRRRRCRLSLLCGYNLNWSMEKGKKSAEIAAQPIRNQAMWFSANNKKKHRVFVFVFIWITFIRSK